MKVTIPDELLSLVPLAVMSIIEQATDITNAQFLVPGDERPHDRRVMVQGRHVTLSGTSWDTFVKLREAGADPSWNSHQGRGWSINLFDTTGSPP